MATVYILHSEKKQTYYIGSCNDFDLRLSEHQEKRHKGSWTSQADDWEVFAILRCKI